VKNNHKKKFKELIHKECLAQGARKLTGKDVSVWATFYPPDKRRRDFDNQIASFKAGFDGIADVIGVDDYDWSWRLDNSKEPLGCVIVQVETLESE